MPLVTSSDPKDMREHNTRLVLDVIREAGAISRADIARATQLSRSTITNIVNELLPTGLIHESGTVTSLVGRRPILLQFLYDARAVLGVDMGASHLTVVATNLAGQQLALRHESFPVIAQPAATLARVRQLFVEVSAEAGYPLEQMLGVGVALPAPLEGSTLDRPSPIIMPRWVGIDLCHELGAACLLPIFLDNDANLGALAEKWWGHGRDFANLAYIKVATGVGCGLIINHAIYRGEGGTAGEIGHSAIVPDGPPCRCGLNGCLESLTGAPAIVAAVQARLDGGAESSLAGQPLSVGRVAEAARLGDPLAAEVVRSAGRYLGIAIANLLNLVNPGVIVLGGTLTAAGDVLLTQLRQTVRERSFSKSNAEATITTSRLGEDVIAVGAATLVIERLFHDDTTPILLAIAPRNGRR